MRRRTMRLVLPPFVAIVAAFLLPGPAAASHPLRTGIVDGGPFNVPTWMPAAFADVRAAGSTVIRFYATWGRVARGARPADPASPGDPAYNWSLIDQQVQNAKANGLEPILIIERAPFYA